MKLWHLYAAIGVIAFVATGSQALAYTDAGLIGGTVDFWRDAITGNPASLFLVYDVSLLFLAVWILLWIEGARVGISAGTRIVFIVLSAVVGVSTFVPLFLAYRQRKLDAVRGVTD
jgi:hypothetical protein